MAINVSGCGESSERNPQGTPIDANGYRDVPEKFEKYFSPAPGRAAQKN